MYLVELRPGKEELYRTGDELAAAIRNGDVDMHSRIYHRATSKWISVTLHPQYKAIVSERPAGRRRRCRRWSADLDVLQRLRRLRWPAPTTRTPEADDESDGRRSQSSVAPAARAQRDRRAPASWACSSPLRARARRGRAARHGPVPSRSAGRGARSEPRLAVASLAPATPRRSSLVEQRPRAGARRAATLPATAARLRDAAPRLDRRAPTARRPRSMPAAPRSCGRRSLLRRTPAKARADAADGAGDAPRRPGR